MEAPPAPAHPLATDKEPGRPGGDSGRGETGSAMRRSAPMAPEHGPTLPCAAAAHDGPRYVRRNAPTCRETGLRLTAPLSNRWGSLRLEGWNSEDVSHGEKPPYAGTAALAACRCRALPYAHDGRRAANGRRLAAGPATPGGSRVAGGGEFAGRPSRLPRPERASLPGATQLSLWIQTGAWPFSADRRRSRRPRGSGATGADGRLFLRDRSPRHVDRWPHASDGGHRGCQLPESPAWDSGIR